VHAWAGARPLFKDKRVAATDTRHMSRGMSILDHGTRDGVKGIVSIIGGKLTTYRLMAKNVVDVMCEQLGEDRPCTTDQEVVPGSTEGHNYLITHRLHDNEKARAKHLEAAPNTTPSRSAIDDQIICECELMSRKMLTDLLAEQPDATLDDLRRQLRLGMGPCQGGFCSMRATGVALEEGSIDVERATGLLRLFLKNRWIGLWPILYGEQVRQTALDDWIFQGTFDVEHLPVPESEVAL
jgi:glycerol-3-phosphate dehydrogenase